MTRRLAPVALFFLLAACPGPDPKPAGSWRTAGSLHVARAFTVTVPLQSGKVLVAGGQLDRSTGWTATTSAEVYDPAAGTWATVAPMAAARLGPCAALLPSGKVLVAGGGDFGVEGALDTAEVYDPGSNTWTTISSPLSAKRFDPTCTLLSTGKVLVAGGWTGNTANTKTPTADLYDPATDTFSPTGSMTAGRNGHTATVLASGEVLVVGGFEVTAISSAERYDPATGRWTVTGSLPAIGSLPAGVGVHTATRLASGKVLVAGGCFDYSNRGNGPSDRGAFLYDPGTGSWTATASLPWGLSSAVALPLASGDVLMVGGTSNSGGGLRTTRYQVASGTWVDGPPTPSDHGGGLGAARLTDGTWLVTGGVVPGTPRQLSVGTTEIFTE
jgi:N-acetylneuraminic acid mutarotase